ncbi:MAG: type II toxin-antitoxin system VapC family toxin [Ktedonobacteraceae bacterium]
MSDLLIVVDASVWVSWLRPSETNHRSSSTWMEQFITKNGFLVSPAMLLIEVAASISRQTGQALRAKEAITKLNSISKIQIFPMDSSLVQMAVDIATDLQLRAGDAIYVALAHQLNIPLISWDKEQIQKASSLITTYTPENYIFPETDNSSDEEPA